MDCVLEGDDSVCSYVEPSSPTLATISSVCRQLEKKGNWNKQQTLFQLSAPVGRHHPARQANNTTTAGSLEGAAELLLALLFSLFPSHTNTCTQVNHRLRWMCLVNACVEVVSPQDGVPGPVCCVHLENEGRGHWYESVVSSQPSAARVTVTSENISETEQPWLPTVTTKVIWKVGDTFPSPLIITKYLSNKGPDCQKINTKFACKPLQNYSFSLFLVFLSSKLHPPVTLCLSVCLSGCLFSNLHPRAMSTSTCWIWPPDPAAHSQNADAAASTSEGGSPQILIREYLPKGSCPVTAVTLEPQSNPNPTPLTTTDTPHLALSCCCSLKLVKLALDCSARKSLAPQKSYKYKKQMAVSCWRWLPEIPCF